MLHKSAILIIVVLLFILLLLAGCSGSPGGDAIAPGGGVYATTTFAPVGTPNSVDTAGGITVSVHDNLVQICCPQGNITQQESFTLTGYTITGGQPWEGVTSSSTSDGVLTIDVKCGRKGSHGPLAWFEDFVTNQSYNAVVEADCSNTAANYPPSSMNFAITGVLTINVDNGGARSYTICLGQTGDMLQNIWYMSGEKFTYKGSGQIVTPDGWYTCSGNGNNHSFAIWSN